MRSGDSCLWIRAKSICRSRSCSVDISVSIAIIRDWVHSMCIISQKVTSRGEKRDERRAGEREGATGVTSAGSRATCLKFEA